MIQRFSDISCSPFCSQWVGWGETKLWHFSLTLLFDALTILRYDLYQFMAVILRYVWTFKIVYIILKPISFWISEDEASIFEIKVELLSCCLSFVIRSALSQKGINCKQLSSVARTSWAQHTTSRPKNTNPKHHPKN